MTRTPLSYVLLVVFSAAAAVTSYDYLFPRLKVTDVACKTTTDVEVKVDKVGAKNNTILLEEQWNQIKQVSCPNQVPNRRVHPTLFEQAQIELGFDMNNIPNTPGDIEFIEKFFTFCKGGVGYTSLDGEHNLVYLKIWKSANDQIRKNIERVVRKKDNQWHFDMPMKDMNKDVQDLDYSELWSPIPLSKRNQTCVVTAVRDPVEHFLSAYNEIEFRSTDSFLRANGVKNFQRTRYHERYENGTDERFERYVSDFVYGASSNRLFPSAPFPSNILHSFSQSGVLWVLKQQKDLMGVNSPQLTAYLASISNVNLEFPNLVSTNCLGFEEEFGKPFTKQYDHPSQQDEKGFYKAAKRVWSKQGATSRALCALHLMDYACFDLIPIPDLCQDVFSDASFIVRLLTLATSEQDSKEANTCNFCEGGIADPAMLVPETGGLTCALVKAIATKELNGTETCRTVQEKEEVCCPTKQVDDSHA